LQGQVALGSVIVETDSTGLALFRAALPGASVANDVFNATITVAGFNTSEFSGPISVGTVTTDIPPVVTTSGPATDPVGVPVVFNSTVTDASPSASSFTYTYAWSVTQVGNPAFNSPGPGNPAFTPPIPFLTDQPTLQFTPSTPATYIIGLTVTDSLGSGGTAAPLTLVVTSSGTGVVIANAPAISGSGTLIKLSSTVVEPSGGRRSRTRGP
jgi:hypothetical protein